MLKIYNRKNSNVRERREPKSFKRVLVLGLLFFVILTVLSATPLEWKWQSDDENIKYYRYQLYGKNENNWTVVSSDITSVILDSNPYITKFYLQASCDGEVWSEMSVGTYVQKLKDVGLITLSWKGDKSYKYYRYQRDSDSEDGWNYVDGKTESREVPYHKGVNTYYVQSSLDGKVWSESGVATYIDSSCTCDSLLWSWEGEDDGINYYRYQRDEKNDDGWTVVDSSVTETELPAYEGLNVLYVEASYDKENWSETKDGTYIYESKPYRTRKWEVSLKALPYAYQKINYTTENTVENRSSVYGGGIRGEFRYNFSSLFPLGFDTSVEYYSYEAFHSYFDFKAALTARIKLIGSDESRNKVYLTFGGGADFVIRDDGETGCYPLISYGIRDSFKFRENMSLDIGVDINHTFQNGTNVLHILPSIGITYTWGCKAGCTMCKGGCR